MNKAIAIRREDKNEWERRTPLTPAEVKALKREFGLRIIVQPSKIRVFSDEEYLKAGAEISEDLSPADIVIAIKEIPERLFLPGKTYVFFSHTIKGQPHNMSMLRRMMALGCHLIDYERVMNEQNQRLIFFGKYAGLAGMVETLHALGQKLKLQGFATPLARIKQAYQYPTVEAAKTEIASVGHEIDAQGLPPELAPLVVGFAGYGNVSQGAQEIFDLLPHKVVSPAMLTEMMENFGSDTLNFYKVVFKEEDMVKPKAGAFTLQDYYDHPEKYESRFSDYLPHLQALVNCIYWTERYPRLVTKAWLRNASALASALNLRVIGDISCDIDGSVEITHQATKPDHACFTYIPAADRYQDGIQREGVTVMAVDNLPCEFPRESSSAFADVLKRFIPEIAACDFGRDFASLKLPYPIQKALILHRGRLTPDYQYMDAFVRLAKEES